MEGTTISMTNLTQIEGELMSKADKLNIVNCEIQELINDCPADLRLMLALVEEVRTDLMKTDRGGTDE